MKSIFINIGIAVGVTLLQFMLLLIMIHLLALARDVFVDSAQIDLYWGRNLWIGLRYVFLPSLMAANIAVIFINRSCVMLAINTLLPSAVLYIWFSSFALYPYRSLSIYTIYIILFCTGIYIIKKLKSR